MAAPDWRALRVVLNDRAAIYAESVPASLADLGPEALGRFSHQEAQGLLYTFAGAWPTLGRDASDSATYVAIADLACRLREVELTPGAIVVDDVVAF